MFSVQPNVTQIAFYNVSLCPKQLDLLSFLRRSD